VRVRMVAGNIRTASPAV